MVYVVVVRVVAVVGTFGSESTAAAAAAAVYAVVVDVAVPACCQPPGLNLHKMFLPLCFLEELTPRYGSSTGMRCCCRCCYTTGDRSRWVQQQVGDISTGVGGNKKGGVEGGRPAGDEGYAGGRSADITAKQTIPRRAHTTGTTNPIIFVCSLLIHGGYLIRAISELAKFLSLFV